MQDQIALVTGASRGIGKAIATELLNRGATVIGTATTEAGANAISDYIKQSGGGGGGKVLNVTSTASIETLVKDINEQFGAVSILVNNAGITRDNLLMRMKDEEWNDIIATNLNSVYHLSKACLKGMTKARKGRIINIASVVGVSGNAGQTNYSAAKAGIIGFSKSLAREIGSRNITVNVVAPGFIETDMTSKLDETHRQALVQSIALGRFGQVQDIACAVAFLASAEASYITGVTLHVNGGMYMS
jgi:3-oxoacyl-[acyl-carrier protein] reductase